MAIVSFLSLNILQRNSNLFPVYLAVLLVVLPNRTHPSARLFSRICLMSHALLSHDRYML